MTDKPTIDQNLRDRVQQHFGATAQDYVTSARHASGGGLRRGLGRFGSRRLGDGFAAAGECQRAERNRQGERESVANAHGSAFLLGSSTERSTKIARRSGWPNRLTETAP